ncbi:hypothetical protein SEA_GREENHEARTS_1 [Arthrobacter phage GreenHearts]|uniref:Minor tail protein n=1 Tax=Arthrobacter phage GreenHearts TaxID=2499003 RepID=A0A3S9UCE3_9CAUD|nr:minor tail protein [Arthrobacter phage GreenHearts]AZS07980.1 hypothetical protein SEA_GREENHEARTS_1 [Arthrobacter phage GreenHearts]
MTIVNFGLRHPGAAGRVMATGRVAWIPTERKIDGSLVVLPSRVSVTLTPEASAEIEPGVYLFHEEAVGGISAYRIVPNAIEVEYASLVAVDPTTLDPEAQPEAAWYAFVESLNASNADMLASALSAQHSAELAQLSATGSQTSAAASAQLSAGSALDSQSSANASANSATQAGTARDGAVSAQASAAGYASAASGYAGDAQDSADEAAVQAGLALTRAGTATDKAAEATAAVLGFGIGTVSTVGPSVPASATVTGPVGNRVLNLTLPRGATPVFSVLETTTGPETPGATGLKGDTGTKGDPGGIVLGTLITGPADLNDYKTPGVYRTTTTANILNLPWAFVGTLTVWQNNNATPMFWQEYTPVTSGGAQVYWRRAFGPTQVWGPWRSYTSTRVDTTAGRAIYQWDDLNLREQLMYGDTGFRQLTLENGYLGGLYLRRWGSMVNLTGTITRPVGGSLNGIFYSQIHIGFRPQNSNWVHHPVRHSNNAAWFSFYRKYTEFTFENSTGDSDAAQVRIDVTWMTVDPWPTVLPGIASGTIPNS